MVRLSFLILFLFISSFAHAEDSIRFSGTGAIDISITAQQNSRWQLDQFMLALSDFGGGGELVISIDAAAGSEFDNDILSYGEKTMRARKLIIKTYPGGIKLDANDIIIITWSNPDSVGWAIKVTGGPSQLVEKL
jgi:hypothetical protein